MMGFFCIAIVGSHLLINLFLIMASNFKQIKLDFQIWLARRNLKKQRDLQKERLADSHAWRRNLRQQLLKKAKVQAALQAQKVEAIEDDTESPKKIRKVKPTKKKVVKNIKPQLELIEEELSERIPVNEFKNPMAVMQENNDRLFGTKIRENMRNGIQEAAKTQSGINQAVTLNPTLGKSRNQLRDTGQAIGREEDLFQLAFGDKSGNGHDWDFGAKGNGKWFDNDTHTRQGSMAQVKTFHTPNQNSEALEQHLRDIESRFGMPDPDLESLEDKPRSYRKRPSKAQRRRQQIEENKNGPWEKPNKRDLRAINKMIDDIEAKHGGKM